MLTSQHAELRPDSLTYAALMRPCEHDGDMKTAVELYEEAVASQKELHVDLFNTLISVCTRAEEFPAAENIFQEMREKVRRRDACARTRRAEIKAARARMHAVA